MTTRDHFIDQMRRALGRERSAETPPPPEVEDTLVRLAEGGDGLLDLFEQRATEVGMEVRRSRDDGVAHAVCEWLDDLSARRVCVAAGDANDALERALDGAGIERLSWEGDPSMASHYAADAGVTDVRAALAETGTLICDSGPSQGRGHSLVPPVHVAIVRAADVVPDMLDFMRTQQGRPPGDLPSGRALITGPSKTADIEGVMVTGVHGPGKVGILLVEPSDG